MTDLCVHLRLSSSPHYLPRAAFPTSCGSALLQIIRRATLHRLDDCRDSLHQAPEADRKLPKQLDEFQDLAVSHDETLTHGIARIAGTGDIGLVNDALLVREHMPLLK